MALTRKTPMKRVSFKRPERPSLWGVFEANAVKSYSTIKKRAKRKRVGHDQAMLDVCREQPCYLRVAGVCRGSVGFQTVVPCHANELALGKGKGLKVPDKYTVPGCMECHAWLDAGSAPRAEKQSAWRTAYREWSIERDGEEDLNVAV
jgi:hypothetical protein